jgi:hypothetical protein
MDPNNSNTLVAGGTSIWRTTDNAENWSQIRTPLVNNPRCSAIDVARGNSSLLWVGYANGTISATRDGGTTWRNVAWFGIPNRFVTDIAINPIDTGVVMVTFGGYQPNNVWQTTNSGTSWQQRTGSIPNFIPSIQVNTVRYHPSIRNWVYVGTDLGVFASEDDGANWSITPRFTNNEGPVNVEVDELFWQGNDFLIAATHGRGMFRVGPLGTVYVDLNNTGTQDGTLQNPYRTITAAFNASGPGTTISIKTGTYHEGQLNANRRTLVARDGQVTVQP